MLVRKKVGSKFRASRSNLNFFQFIHYSFNFLADAEDLHWTVGRRYGDGIYDFFSPIDLRFFEGLRGKQVAERLGSKPDAVYKSLQRIYATLSDCIRAKLAAIETGDSI